MRGEREREGGMKMEKEENRREGDGGSKKGRGKEKAR